MVITLDNGQFALIYQDQNILPQIKEYIDKEIYDLLEEKFCNADYLEIQNESLNGELADAEEFIGEFQEKYDKLEDEYNDLYEEYKELESQKDKILSQINDLADELSEDNFQEIGNKLKEIYWNN